MGAIPYPGIRTQELFEMLVVENYRLSKPANCSSELYELLKDCWQPFPEQRPTFAQLLGRLQDLAKKPSRHILQGENYAYEFMAMPTDVCMRRAEKSGLHVRRPCHVKRVPLLFPTRFP